MCFGLYHSLILLRVFTNDSTVGSFKIFCQIYAPMSDKESTFHRMLYVFMCPSMSCLLRDQHEQWKRSEENLCRRYLWLHFDLILNVYEFSLVFYILHTWLSRLSSVWSSGNYSLEAWRFSVVSCLDQILSTRVNLPSVMASANQPLLEVT